MNVEREKTLLVAFRQLSEREQLIMLEFMRDCMKHRPPPISPLRLVAVGGQAR